MVVKNTVQNVVENMSGVSSIQNAGKLCNLDHVLNGGDPVVYAGSLFHFRLWAENIISRVMLLCGIAKMQLTMLSGKQRLGDINKNLAVRDVDIESMGPHLIGTIEKTAQKLVGYQYAAISQNYK